MKEIKLNQFNTFMINIFNPYYIKNGLSLYELLLHKESQETLSCLQPFHLLFK